MDPFHAEAQYCYIIVFVYLLAAHVGWDMSNTDLPLCPFGDIGRHATQTEKESASLCRYQLYIDRRNINRSDVHAILLIK
jgi:hypothetical protein